MNRLMQAGFRASIDNRNETLKRKVRDAQVAYIPAIVTIGAREKENDEVSVRTLDGKVRTLSTNAFFDRCTQLARTFARETAF